MKDPELWARIVRYKFPRGFDEKLKTKFGRWTQAATIVREEYRRFAYLAMISPDEVTPSHPIDRVWHLHLGYTRDYWDNFCAQVLQRNLHHHPDDGSRGKHRYAEQYAATLALYAREFRATPPHKVWPTKESLKRTRSGASVAVFGVVAALMSYKSGGNDTMLYLAASLSLMCGGVYYSMINAPYRYGKTPSTGGCGGGDGAGCGGGGGCGGG